MRIGQLFIKIKCAINKTSILTIMHRLIFIIYGVYVDLSGYVILHSYTAPFSSFSNC